MSTELTVIERAERAIAFADRKAELARLAQESVRIVEITNPAGREECHAARMRLKTTRVEIQKAGKEARDDANAFAKAVIAKEKELVDVIAPEESRLQALQDEWDAAREAERQAKIRAEAERVEAIQRRIAELRGAVAEAAGRSSAAIHELMGEVESVDVRSGEFAEFVAQAGAAQDETLQRLGEMLAAAAEREEAEAREKAEREAEAQRLAAERAELERLRAEAEARRQAEERDAAERRAAAEAELRAEREKLAAERAAAEKAAAEERARLAAIAAEQEAERKRLQAIEDAKAKAEADRIAAEQRAEAERLQAERVELARQKAEAEARERQRQIDSATLIEAAGEAHALLLQLAADHLTTAKLGAALAREHDLRIAA